LKAKAGVEASINGSVTPKRHDNFLRLLWDPGNLSKYAVTAVFRIGTGSTQHWFKHRFTGSIE